MNVAKHLGWCRSQPLSEPHLHSRQSERSMTGYEQALPQHDKRDSKPVLFIVTASSLNSTSNQSTPSEQHNCKSKLKHLTKYLLSNGVTTKQVYALLICDLHMTQQSMSCSLRAVSSMSKDTNCGNAVRTNLHIQILSGSLQ